MNEELIFKLMTKSLTGQISKEEKIALEKMLQSSEKLQHEFNKLASYWYTPLKQDSTTEAWKIHRLRIENDESKTHTGKRFWYAAASVIILLGSLFFYLHNQKKEKLYSSNFQTLIEKKRILLPDSSVVVLNSNSKIEFDSSDFLKGYRNVRFEGEGYFDIHHDKRHPFAVHIANGTIKVLGTAFNITSYNCEATATVSLIRGKIAFEKNKYNEKDLIILPNQKLIISKSNTRQTKDGLKIVSFNNMELDGKRFVKDTLWMQDKILMNNDRLGELLTILEHRYGVTFRVEDSSINEYIYSGELGNNSLAEILSALSIVHPFTFKIEKNIVRLSN